MTVSVSAPTSRFAVTKTSLIQGSCLVFIGTMFFSNALSQLVSGAIGFLDELGLVISVLTILYTLATNRLPPALRYFALSLFAFSVTFVLSTLFFSDTIRFSVSTMVYVTLGTLNHIKMFLFTWLLLYLGSIGRLRVPQSFIVLLVAITIVGYLTNHLLPGLFNALFDFREVERVGVTRAVGLHLTTVAGPTFLSLLMVSLLFDHLRSNGRNLGLYICLSALVALYVFYLTTTRSGLMIYLLGVLAVLYLSSAVSRFGLLLAAVAVVALVAFGNVLEVLQVDLVTSAVEMMSGFFTGDVSVPRVVMVSFAIDLAQENFPLGSGVTTYASPYSEGSSVYSDLGIANLYFVEAFNGVIDSNLGSIIGELGVLGVVFIALNLVFLAQAVSAYAPRTRITHIYLTFLVTICVLNTLISPVLFKGDWCVLFALLFHRVAFGTQARKRIRLIWS